MANPLKGRGAKSQSNLKRGGPGRKKATEQEKEVRRISKKLLSDPAYQKQLRKRLRSGSIQPGVEAMLWYYAHGKPVDVIEDKRVIPVRITHEYADTKPEPKK